MKKTVSLLIIFISSYSFCQVAALKKINKQEDISEGYTTYRYQLSKPEYGLKKMNSLKMDSSLFVSSMDKKTYQSLTLREKFTYNLIHGESFMQNCSIGMPDADASKKIFAQLSSLSFVFGDFGWGESQRKFFITNRDSVIFLMKNCISKTNKAGLNFKTVIVNINAKEMSRLLINLYSSDKKDHDILTVLMLLMKDNKYEPFLSTQIFVQLYGPDKKYSDSIVFNAATETNIIKYAMQFCNDNNIK